MAIDKTTVNKTLSALDKSAENIQKLAASRSIDPKVAASLVQEIDAFSDRLQIAAYGQKSFDAFKAKAIAAARQAKVLQSDRDETFMKTFDNPNKVIESDSDETFMHRTDPSFNAKGQPTFDLDGSSAVSGRDEYAIRDLSQYSDATKKQPSWERGPAGKSTKQGSSKTASNNPRATKCWAPLSIY
jgi:predicted enzyme involved in methoxymalonyl-ACP biosynthesis